VAGASRQASQSRIPVEHEVRIRGVKEEHTRREWAYFTYPARLFESINAMTGYRLDFGFCSTGSRKFIVYTEGLHGASTRGYKPAAGVVNKFERSHYVLKPQLEQLMER
jgi:hypothetical protein